MDYLLFDLLAVALPATLLLLPARRRAVLLAPATALAAVAVLWTAPWDEHLVRTGVWAYAPDAVLARIGAVPLEEYAFVVLEVLLVGAWALHTGALGGAPQLSGLSPGRPARGRGAAGWLAVAAAGAALALRSGDMRYLGLLLMWAGPPFAVQRAAAGDVLARRRGLRLRTALPAALWLCVADRCALAAGIWTISPGSATGLAVAGLPVEEALFFGMTCLLVTDGLLLATDPLVLQRVTQIWRHGRQVFAPRGASQRDSDCQQPAAAPVAAG